MMFVRWCFALVLLAVANVSGESKVAIAHLQTATISGSIEFTETSEGLLITGSIIGLPAGRYGFHVHELGDISTCDATGAHFDPDSFNHGGPNHDIRHVGDLGNAEFVGGIIPVAQFNVVDRLITLEGRNNILGRALVLHEQEDDLGLGGNANSLTTGNAGARVACGVIGLKSPSAPWNAAVSITPSLLLLIALFCSLVYYK